LLPRLGAGVRHGVVLDVARHSWAMALRHLNVPVRPAPECWARKLSGTCVSDAARRPELDGSRSDPESADRLAVGIGDAALRQILI
jgi:hypothetical protein